MPWIIFGDFNEIVHPSKKSGGQERDVKQMEGFRNCLGQCGLVAMGSVGQRFTWCNGQSGDQRTKLRLDRMVTNEEWMSMFIKASVMHCSMSILDHCPCWLYLSNTDN
ncbi:hypothetical protein ACB092_10G064700 [Castanea dentata]